MSAPAGAGTKRRAAAALVVAGVVLRLAFAWLHPPQPRGAALADPDDYVKLARSVALDNALARDGKPSAEREPVYPLLLGGAFKVLGVRYAAIAGINTLLGAGCLWLLFLLGTELYGELVGTLAAALGAFYPPFLYYNAIAERETAEAFFGLLTLWLLVRSRRARGFAAAGVAAALGALTKTTMLPFGLLLAPAAAALLLRRERPWRPVAAYLAGFLLVYSFWPIRNFRAMGGFVLGATEGGGDNLYVYQVVPQELGGTPQQGEILRRDPVYQAASRMGVVERDRYFLKEGLRLVRDHPWRYARLVAWRLFWDFWRVLPRPRAYDYSTRLLRAVALLSDGWIIPLGFLGMLLSRLKRPRAAWLYLYVFAEAFSYSLIFTIIRYRFAAMPVVLLYAAVALERLWSRLSGT